MILIKNEEIEKRINWFNDWISQKKVTLDYIKSKIPGLDYSPNSLNKLEAYLLDKFNDPLSVYLIEHNDFLNAVCLYIGEVYRINISLNIEWGVNIDTTQEYQGIYNFPCYLKSYKEFVGFNPFSKIPFALNKRTGDKFYTHLMHNIKLFKKDSDSKEKQKVLTQFKGCKYNYFLFYNEYNFKFREIMSILTSYYKEKKRNFKLEFILDNQLELILDETYSFYFYLDTRPEVLEESKEMSQSLNTPDLAKCNSRIEFWGDDDPNLDYMNESLFILERIKSSNPHVIMVDVNK